MAENYESQSDKFKSLLRQSKTAYSPGSKPTSNDIFLQRKYQAEKNAEEAVKQSNLKAQWYEEKKAEGEGAPASNSLIGKVLDTMATPGYAVTGAIETALGKGRKTGLLENMADNISEKGTMGDILRSYGINNYVAAPLGFALDIAVDPLSWVTGEGLINKIGTGAYKGLKSGEGLAKGAKLGAEADLLGKAAWTGNKALGLAEKLKLGNTISAVTKSEQPLEGAGRARTAMNSLLEKSTAKKREYYDFTGTDVKGLVEKQLDKPRAYERASQRLDETSWGQKVKTLFGYDSSKAFYSDDAREQAERLASGKNKEWGEFMGKDMQETANLLFKKSQDKTEFKRAQEEFDLADQARRNAIASKRINEEFNKVMELFADDINSQEKLRNLSISDKKKFMDGYSHYKTGLDGYNKGVAKTLLKPKAREFFNNMAVMHGWFKNMKIGGNVVGSSATNSLFGNAAMTSMVGINIASRGMKNGMLSAYRMVQKGDMKELGSLLSDSEWKEILEKRPQLFEDTFGIRADVVRNGWTEIEKEAQKIIQEEGKSFKNMDPQELRTMWQSATERAAGEVQLPSGLRTAARVAPAGELPSTFLSGEIMRGPYAEFLNKLKEKGGAYEKLYKVLTVPTETYGKFDQIYRMGLALNLTREGITLPEFKKLIRRIPMNMSDVTEKGGKVYLKPLKAMETAQETYLNYAAMPAFVQIMRTIPLVGSPFLSFSYGMLNHASKTLMYNPEFYNKVQYMLHEISGEKSPLEKEALNSEYYSWMNQPGMMKVPTFFEDHPIYLNVANMIPHYTMSLLQANQRDYKSKYGQEVSGLIDKSPFFKTPEGQVMMDYIILPTLIQGERPMGSFGQNLWEKDASTATKVGYAGRSLLEALTPPVMGYFGPGASYAGLPEDKLKYVPSYSFRKGAEAVYGKGVTGLQGKENATERTMRAMSAMAGLPLYPIALQYSNKKKSSE